MATMLRIVTLVLLVGSVCLCVWSQREGLAVQWNQELRELKAQRIHAARSLDILKDHSSVIAAVVERPATVESLTVSLIETLEQRSVSLDVQLSSLSVTGSSEPEQQSERIDGSLRSLRVEFDGVLHRAIDLLSMFDAVRDAADWRPIEVRGCDLVRDADELRLHTVCAIDVYYFPEIDA